MTGTSAKKLAKTLNLTFEELKESVRELGIDLEGEEAIVSSEQQLLLMRNHIARQPKASESRDVTLEELRNANKLVDLNDLLTRAMAERIIQSLLKDDDLQVIIDDIRQRAIKEDQQLLAVAILARLAAVSRARAQNILESANNLLRKEPPSLNTLPDTDGKQKHYAAQVVGLSNEPWAINYRYKEALGIDTADNARRELLTANLSKIGNLSSWVQGVIQHASEINVITNAETRLKRTRRVFAVMSDIASTWRGSTGTDLGSYLSESVKTFCHGRLDELDQETLFTLLDHLLDLLVRSIELRFSTALDSETYMMIEQGKRTLGPGLWAKFISESETIHEVRIALLETALVLARQNRMDQKISSAFVATFASRAQSIAAIKRHFEDTPDLDPDIAAWWKSAGEAKENNRLVEHQMGNNEDAQIGGLLIEVESNHEAMKKLGEDVVVYLSIAEPVLAATVKRAVDNYESIAQTARRLARMRKLSKTNLKGQRVEFNPLEHEMLGDKRAGVREVKVIRDGIKKEYAGRIKTLVKPWVEPTSD